MKIQLLLSLFACFLSLNSFAKTLDGYYITLENDTIEASMEIPIIFLLNSINFREIQQKVKIKDKYIHNKALMLYPENIKEYGFEFKGKHIIMISGYDPLKNCYYNERHSNFIFLQLIIEGKHLNYLRFVQNKNDIPSKKGVLSGVLYLFRKGESGELYQPRPLKYKKDLARYLSDCSEVQEKILKRTYHRRDVDIIIDQYDKCINYLGKN